MVVFQCLGKWILHLFRPRFLVLIYGDFFVQRTVESPLIRRWLLLLKDCGFWYIGKWILHLFRPGLRVLRYGGFFILKTVDSPLFGRRFLVLKDGGFLCLEMWILLLRWASFSILEIAIFHTWKIWFILLRDVCFLSSYSPLDNMIFSHSESLFFLILSDSLSPTQSHWFIILPDSGFLKICVFRYLMFPYWKSFVHYSWRYNYLML